jgi:hypothetical protein
MKNNLNNSTNKTKEKPVVQPILKNTASNKKRRTGERLLVVVIITCS